MLLPVETLRLDVFQYAGYYAGIQQYRAQNGLFCFQIVRKLLRAKSESVQIVSHKENPSFLDKGGSKCPFLSQ